MTTRKQAGSPVDAELPAVARRERAVLALLSSTTIVAAAATAGVNEKTLRRWLKDPAFAAEVREARRQTLAHASTRLVAGCGSAAGVLLGLAEDENAPPAARASAARTILEMASNFLELEDLAARVEALEHSAEVEAE